MSQYLPIGLFEKLQLPNAYELEQIVEDFLQVPDDNESGFFIECDIIYPAEIKGKTKKTFHSAPIKQKQIQSCSQNL